MNYNPFLTSLPVEREAKSFVFFIFGVTGDLTRKKLLPALFSLFAKGHISRFKIAGFARRPWTKEDFRREAASILDSAGSASAAMKEAFLANLDYISSSFEDAAGYGRINSFCEGYTDRLYYLSTPPSEYPAIIENLGKAGLAKSANGKIRIVVEKPFGRDFDGAQALNETLYRHFTEDQIYRIDHYLGKETVQNIMLLRFGNGLFEPVWNSRYIHNIQISVAEKIGVENRANYYERAGALRDMVQNHLFQLLCLMTMEPPNDLEADSIHSEKVKILKSLRPFSAADIQRNTVRGQYATGFIDGSPAPAYREEPGVSPDSRSETFVALKIFLDTWRWAGIPIFLRTGKRLSRRVSEIAVQFKEPPLKLFGGEAGSRNTLLIRIQPDEGITLNMNAKIPGYSTKGRPVNMDFAYGSAFGETPPEAYERLILDALQGDSTLYTRRDEIEASWTFITNILKSWAEDSSPIPQYVPGSSGPEEIRMLTKSEDVRWRKL
jgi:glucose-6-phosphate 1-dehydrogenase